MKTYLEKLKDLREDRDLKQSDIAAILNVKQNTYSQYENGTRKLPIEEFRKLCIFYGVSADFLLDISPKIPT